MPSCVECGVDLVGARCLEMVVQLGARTGLFIRECLGDDVDEDDGPGAFCSAECLDVWVTIQRLERSV